MVDVLLLGIVYWFSFNVMLMFLVLRAFCLDLFVGLLMLLVFGIVCVDLYWLVIWLFGCCWVSVYGMCCLLMIVRYCITCVLGWLCLLLLVVVCFSLLDFKLVVVVWLLVWRCWLILSGFSELVLVVCGGLMVWIRCGVDYFYRLLFALVLCWLCCFAT